MIQKYNFKSWLTGLLAVVFVLFLNSGAFAQTEIFNEPLRDGALPTGWSQVEIDFQTGAGGYARFDDLTSELETPGFDGSSYGSVDVDLSVAKWGSGGDGPITVEYSLNGGTDWLKAGDSEIPTGSTYIDDTITIGSVSATMVIRFTRPDSPSRKRLRDVVVTGMPVPVDPFLSVTPASLSDFVYNTIDGGPSDSQTFAVSGDNLDPADATITISAPANFEVSLDDVSFGASRTVDAAGGELTSTTVYVRMADGLTEGTYTGDVTVSGGTADPETVSLSGEVEAPLTAVLPYEEGFETDLDGVYVYRVSGGNNWQQGSADTRTYAWMNGFNTGLLENTWLILPGLDLTGTEMETMRFETWWRFGNDDADNFLKLWYSTDYPGLGDPTGYTWTELAFDQPATDQVITPSGDVDLSGIDASSVYIAFQYNYDVDMYRNWRVYDIEIFEAGNPELLLSESTLTGFTYPEGSGPSASQQVLLSGSSLDPEVGSITITGSANFEVSSDNAIWNSTATIDYTGGAFTDEPFYVRLAAGLGIGDYTGETIAVTGGGADAVNVTASGSVTEVPPALTATEEYVQQFEEFVSFETLPNGWSVSNSNYGGLWGTGTGAGLRGEANVLGFQHTSGTGTFTSTLELVNDTGGELTDVYISYTGRVERTGEGRSPIWTVEVNSVEQAGLSYSTVESLETTQYLHVSGLSVADGDVLSISWSSERGAGSGSSKQIGISDVVVSASPFLASSVLGAEGWRILATPGTDVTFNDVLGNIWTQGFSGSNYDVTGVESNVYMYSDADKEFQEPTSINNRFGTQGTGSPSHGRAALVYVYADDNRNQIDDPFPKLLLYDGSTTDGPVTYGFSYTDSGSPADDGWFLIGNPFNSPIDWNSIVVAERNVNITDVFYIYDHENDAYRLINGFATPPDVPSDTSIIAPHQGGWIKVATDAPASLQITEDDISTDSAQLYNNPSEIASFRINLEADDRADYVQFTFRDNASLGIDRSDAYQLAPMTNHFAHIFTRIDDVPMMLNNLPREFTQYELPIGIKSSISGEMTLSWPQMYQVPDEWSVFLVDNITGERINLAEQDSYTFMNTAQVDPASIKSLQSRKGSSPVLQTEMKNADRFVLEVSLTSTSVPDNELPAVLALNQNYPNPFNPTTLISYDLPEAADVRLDVFNIQGQRVATLVNTAQNAGTHNVTFDAVNLASGVYIYRLQAGATVLTKKMTLVK